MAVVSSMPMNRDWVKKIYWSDVAEVHKMAGEWLALTLFSGRVVELTDAEFYHMLSSRSQRP